MIFSREEKQTWSLFNKIGFRFAFLYFTLYCFCLIGSGLFKPLVYWVAKTLLSITYDFSQRGYGGGDTTYQYILLLIIFVLSVFGTTIWSLFDKRKSYNQLNYALILLLRFVLVVVMLLYGFIKVFHMQMVPPVYSQLLGDLGSMSPMGLAWTFMGYSKIYIIFAGASEIVAAILLVSRRLQSVASLFVIAVMGNVFVKNMAFDIPVKIFSFHLMLMGVFLFLTNGKRFVNSIILGKSVVKDASYPVHHKDRLKVIRNIKAVLISIALLLAFSFGMGRKDDFHEILNPIMKGGWKVSSFEKNGQEQPPLMTDKSYWQYFILEVRESASVIKLDQSYEKYAIEIDTIKKRIDMMRRSDSLKIKLNYYKNKDSLELNGIVENDTLHIKLIRKTEKDFNLTNREFRWINEKPNNQ